MKTIKYPSSLTLSNIEKYVEKTKSGIAVEEELLLDFSGLKEMDLAGIQLIVFLEKYYKRADLKLKLNEEIEKVIKSLGLHLNEQV